MDVIDYTARLQAQLDDTYAAILTAAYTDVSTQLRVLRAMRQRALARWSSSASGMYRIGLSKEYAQGRGAIHALCDKHRRAALWSCDGAAATLVLMWARTGKQCAKLGKTIGRVGRTTAQYRNREIHELPDDVIIALIGVACEKGLIE